VLAFTSSFNGLLHSCSVVSRCNRFISVVRCYWFSHECTLPTRLCADVVRAFFSFYYFFTTWFGFYVILTLSDLFVFIFSVLEFYMLSRVCRIIIRLTLSWNDLLVCSLVLFNPLCPCLVFFGVNLFSLCSLFCYLCDSRVGYCVVPEW